MDFWSLTNEEILTGLDIMHDNTLQRGKEYDPLIAFAYDTYLQKLAMMWVECNGDRTLMKIKYNEEIRMADQDEWTLRSKFMSY